MERKKKKRMWICFLLPWRIATEFLSTEWTSWTLQLPPHFFFIFKQNFFAFRILKLCFITCLDTGSSRKKNYSSCLQQFHSPIFTRGHLPIILYCKDDANIYYAAPFEKSFLCSTSKRWSEWKLKVLLRTQEIKTLTCKLHSVLNCFFKSEKWWNKAQLIPCHQSKHEYLLAHGFMQKAEFWLRLHKAKTKYVQRYYSDASLKTLKCSSALSKPSRWHSLANFGDCTHFGLSAVYSVFTNVFKLIHCNDCQFNELLKDIHAFVVQSVTKIE